MQFTPAIVAEAMPRTIEVRQDSSADETLALLEYVRTWLLARAVDDDEEDIELLFLAA